MAFSEFLNSLVSLTVTRATFTRTVRRSDAPAEHTQCVVDLGDWRRSGLAFVTGLIKQAEAHIISQCTLLVIIDHWLKIWISDKME